MSSNSLARLSVELAANTAAFQGDMGKAARIAEKEMGSIKDAAGKMGAAVAAGVVAAGAAFAAMAKNAIDQADEMNDLSVKLGMSTEKLSAYAYAAKMSGASTDAVTTGVQKLSSNLMDAARGQGAAKDAFAALGISVKGANGQIKDNDTIMREVADKFAGFEDGAAKTALAVDIFGRSGADLIPMLNEGAAGLDAMQGEASRLGLVLDEKTAKAAGAFNDKVDLMKAAVGGAVARVTAEMLPAMNSIADKFVKAATDGEFLKSVANGLSVAFKLLVTAAIGLKATISLVGDSIGKLAAAAAAFLSGDFAQAKAIMADTTGINEWKQTVSGISDIWYETAAAADAAAKAQDAAAGKAKGPQYSGSAPGRSAGVRQAKAVDWDKQIMDTVTDAAREQGSAQQLFEREKASAQSAVQSIQQSLMTKRQLLDQDMLQQRMALRQAADMDVISETQKNLMLEQLEVQHKAKIKALDDEELARKRSAMQQTVGFFNNGLNIIANSQSKHAKAAQAIVKAQQLFKIGVDTRAAAMGAYAALAGIPIVGPALGVAAAGAAIAFGAVQASAIGGSVGSTSTPSTPVTPSAASSIEPAYARDDLTKKQTTVLQLPANRMMTGRDLAEWLDEALGDGAQLTNLRVMAV